MANLENRTIKLGKTDGYRYIGFIPPLTKEEFDELPKPVTALVDEYEWQPASVEYHADGSMDVGYFAEPFELDIQFVNYAKRIAEHLGNCSLDTEVRMIGPGSIIAQTNGARPEW